MKIFLAKVFFGFSILSVILFFWAVNFIENSNQNKVGMHFIREKLVARDVIPPPVRVSISFSDGAGVEMKYSSINYMIETPSGVYKAKLYFENVSVCRAVVKKNKTILLDEKYRNRYGTCMEIDEDLREGKG